MATTLVMGASGFLGSHVTRQLVERGDRVRVWVRPTSSDRAFAELPVELQRGELDDVEAVRAAMRGVDAVHYCIVDTRAWVRSPEPLFATNVDGLRHALEAAVAERVPRLVFCSTIGTIAIAADGPVTEDLPHNWLDLGGGYIRSRVAAEELVLRYHRDYALPAVVLCVSTTYGPDDYGPSPQGLMVKAAALGKMPFYVDSAATEVVGVQDAATAFLLAAERGRPGERYIISERCMSYRELFEAAAAATGAAPPRRAMPLAAMRLIGVIGTILAPVLRRDMKLNRTTVRLMHVMPPADHGKATRELGWQPAPTEEAIAAAARFFVERRAAARRE